LNLSSLGAGSHTITASYSGDTNFQAPATPASLTEQIGQASASVTLTASAAPSVFGQPVAISATITGPNGTPTPSGTVTFSIDGSAQSPMSLTNGSAILNLPALNAGNHTITATYSGDTNFEAPAKAVSLTQEIDAASTTVALGSSANPSTFGSTISLTATVSVATPATGTPTGSVIFTIDGTAQNPVSLDANGLATLSVPGLSSGSHAITAQYVPGANFQASSGSLPQQVNAAPATITMAPPVISGQSALLSATVTAPAGAGTPAGVVTFLVDGQPVGTVKLVNGSASFAV
jgi:hypothetical protein